MDIQIFLQARMGSTRFPGKVLKALRGKSVLERVAERLGRVRGAFPTILVTSEEPGNDLLAREGERLGMAVFRGAERNTLDRFVRAARQFGPDAIVRVTADCPLIDSELIDKAIAVFQEQGVDFLGDARPFTYPHGMQFEIIKREALEKAREKARKGFESEEAFLKADLNPGDPVREDPAAKKEYMVCQPRSSAIRITLDYPEDLQLLERVEELLEQEGAKGGVEDVERLFVKHPELLEINKMHNEYL